STLYFYHLINGIPEKQQAQGFRLYPNPFSTQTMLLFDQEQHNSRIRVFDEMGREVENQSFSGRHFILNRDRLPSGNYFIQVTDNHGGRMAKQITIR
ncbi:MAG: T9SS type A sorting domain-containing protein, partial [Flavobacteriales bacterium]|nr:T9SS type A sorting domain-containing protein [Flavobacteriales bacterium]